MRLAIPLAIAIFSVSLLQGQAPSEPKSTQNYGIEADLETYPQGTPKEALGSALLAIGRNRIDYLLAQVTDPQWIQTRIKTVNGTFDALVKETSTQLNADPTAIKDLQRLANDGEWEAADTTASVHLTDVDRRAYFRKVGDRWFLENRTK